MSFCPFVQADSTSPEQAAARVFTPRAKAWLGGLARLLPEDQTSSIVLSLADHGYTSVEIIVEEEEASLLAMPGIKKLKAGAKIAFKNTLVKLKVRPTLACCGPTCGHISNFILKNDDQNILFKQARGHVFNVCYILTGQHEIQS
jgi:hypothetical protein